MYSCADQSLPLVCMEVHSVPHTFRMGSWHHRSSIALSGNERQHNGFELAMTVAVDTVAGTERDKFAACDGGCNRVEAKRIHHPAKTSTQEQHVSLDERTTIPPLRNRSAELLERGPRHRDRKRTRLKSSH